MTPLYAWTVPPEAAGTRLDVWLAAQVPGLSRSAASRHIDAGEVRVRGRASKAGLLLRAGDEVDFAPAPASADHLTAEPIPLMVLYEDADLAVVDKPAGLVTHPAPGHPGHTLVNALRFHFTALSSCGGDIRPGLVHRLDKDTSGVLLVAKHDRAHRLLAERLQAREIVRWYDAVVWGRLAAEPRLVETVVGRDPKDRKRFAVVAGRGKFASTWVQARTGFTHFTLIEAKLNTGRTHQIRLHCRYLGHPIVGDRTYGRAGEQGYLTRLHLPRPERQLLHARRIELEHPVSGKKLVVESPWPADLEDFVRQVKARDADISTSGSGSV